MKTALITGGTHGIGFATAEKLAQNGINICVCSRNRDRVNDALSALSKYNVHTWGFCFNATSLTSIDDTISEIKGIQFPIDILINNVGGGGRWGEEDFLDTPYSIWEQVYNKNMGACIKFTKAFLPDMAQNGWGRVITTTSVYGREAGGRPWYNVSKVAEIAFMKNLSIRKEYVRKGITFNSVAPGEIYISGTGFDSEKAKDEEGFLRRLEDDFPMGRMGKPGEVANVIAFLCSEDASYVNGACIPVDGGKSVTY